MEQGGELAKVSLSAAPLTLCFWAVGLVKVGLRVMSEGHPATAVHPRAETWRAG